MTTAMAVFPPVESPPPPDDFPWFAPAEDDALELLLVVAGEVSVLSVGDWVITTTVVPPVCPGAVGVWVMTLVIMLVDAGPAGAVVRVVTGVLVV
jgi:hypothetical protein